MDFIVDKNAQTVEITEVFDARLDLVWDAYTKPELLDKWWAPKPFISRTKEMDFREGGRRFYAMVSPEGEERWVLQQFKLIKPKTKIQLFNAFADENGNPQLPGSDWDFTFSENEGKTTVRVVIYNESLERMELILSLGFIDGVKAQLENIRALLAELSRS